MEQADFLGMYIAVVVSVIVIAFVGGIAVFFRVRGANGTDRKTVPDKVRGDLCYVRGILNKRFNEQINDLVAMELLVAAYHRGVKIEMMSAYAKTVKTWDIWVKDMSENIQIDEDEIGPGQNAVGIVSGFTSVYADDDE